MAACSNAQESTKAGVEPRITESELEESVLAAGGERGEDRQDEASEGRTGVAQTKRQSRDASKGNTHRSEAVEENNKLLAEFKEVLKSIHGFDNSNHRR
jgi:hypothetical protein